MQIIYNCVMNSIENAKIKRTNIYAPSDSGLMFLLALLLPQFIAVLLIVVFGSGILNIAVVSALISQSAMLIGFFIVSERKKVNYRIANQINFKLNIWIVLIVIAIGIVGLYGFSPYVEWLDNITSSFGYVSSVSNISINTFTQFLGSLLYLAILPAIVEELVFRGIVTNGLKKFGTTTAVILSAVFFALIHQNLQQFVYQFFLGLVLAYIALKTGSIIYTMILHFFNNFVVLLTSYISKSSASAVDYSNLWNNIWPTLVMLVAVGIIVGLIILLNYVLKNVNAKNKDISNLQVDSSVATQTQSNAKIENLKDDKQLKNESQNTTNLQKNEQNIQNNLLKTTKFYEEPFVVCALVCGILFWIFAVVSSFK